MNENFRKVALPVLGSTVAIAAALILAAGALAGGATFADPAGDAAGGAPDITTVTVSATGNGGEFDFAVDMPSATFSSTFFLDLYLDTDRDNTADYLIRLNGAEQSIQISRNDGVSFQPFTASLLQGTSTLQPETVRLGRADIGGASGFNFWLRAWNWVANSNPACCSDDTAAWGYNLPGGTTTTTTTGGATTTAPPSLPPPSSAPAGPASAQPQTPGQTAANSKPTKPQPANGESASTDKTLTLHVAAPRQAIAGRTYTLTIHTAATRPTIACRLSIDGHTLHSRLSQTGTVARCSASLPHGTRGRMLHIAITARLGNRAHTTTTTREIH